MRLTLTLTDVMQAGGNSYNPAVARETVDRERVVINDTSAPAFVIAGMLRAIADDIDPQAIQFVPQDGGGAA